MNIEQEIEDKGLTAPRVTPESIESVIAGEFYFTAADGYNSSPLWIRQELPEPPPASLELLTICVLLLKNGYMVTGENACISPENFDAELGKKIARRNAVNKVWSLEDYVLKNNLTFSKI